jgi:hypothetical protein
MSRADEYILDFTLLEDELWMSDWVESDDERLNAWEQSWAENVSALGLAEGPVRAVVFRRLPRATLEHLADWLLWDRNVAWDRVDELEEDYGEPDRSRPGSKRLSTS